jgi:hypothetical protein
MLCNIQTINIVANNAVSISQEVNANIQEALALIGVVEQQNKKTTIKQLENLLIEYILANMRGDSGEARAIQGQIDQVIQTYERNLQQGNELVAKLKAMETNPGVNPSADLAYLQSLIAALKEDAASGDMSNLDQF